jgi:hypothetical protein
MSQDADTLRRERTNDALAEFERRIQQRILPVSHSECWDLLLNRPPNLGTESPHPPADPLPLRYETHDGVALLRVSDPEAPNRACPECELFGRSHCCGGLVFLFYALRATGLTRPLDWVAVEIGPGLYLPDWELMLENEGRIRLALRAHFEANLDKVSGTPDY